MPRLNGDKKPSKPSASTVVKGNLPNPIAMALDFERRTRPERARRAKAAQNKRLNRGLGGATEDMGPGSPGALAAVERFSRDPGVQRLQQRRLKRGDTTTKHRY